VNSVIVAGRTIRLDPATAIGKGGEADVYAIGKGLALKVFKDPTHPDYRGNPQEQQAAADRLRLHQQKLRHFPLPLPDRVIQPCDPACERSGALMGYTMRLLSGATPLARYADRAFRATGIGAGAVTAIFRDLHATVRAMHGAGVVIGDFNVQNVLVVGSDAYLIDVDSYQFGPFTSAVFTARFVDPLLCEQDGQGLTMTRPYSPDSDWYAFAVLLMQSLLFVDPYGGIYSPPAGGAPVPAAQRPLHRITVFHPDVRYPKPALSPRILPDDLLEQFREVFSHDRRGVFPEALLAGLSWRTCPACGIEHARGTCPLCTQPIAQSPRPPSTLSVRPIFEVPGHESAILFATVQDGALRWVWHDGAQFRREDGAAIAAGKPSPGLTVAIQGHATLLGDATGARTYRPGHGPESLDVDCHDGTPLFAADGARRYWARDGSLWRDGPYGPEALGAALPGQTRFWIGPGLGFGFYRAGRLAVAFVFDPARRGLNDGVPLPPLAGQITDAECAFAAGQIWFFFAERRGGRTVHHCLLIRADGSIAASAQGEPGDGTWLGALHGRCAAGAFLLAATDEGIVRVEAQGSALAVTRRFPQTEAHVDSASALLPAPSGLYAVDRRAIRLLQVT
jgi:hypothetical protein